MSCTYIKFSTPTKKIDESSSDIGTKILKTLVYKPLTYILPKANPEFDGKIENVKQWLLEFESSDEIPSREIGIDEKGETIMILPWKQNYGYWTDNNMKFDDFNSHFKTQYINKEEFENLWNAYEATHS
jgi:hypothetical protein